MNLANQIQVQNEDASLSADTFGKGMNSSFPSKQAEGEIR